MNVDPEKSWYVIANPKAGNGVALKSLPVILHLLKANEFDFNLVETTHRNHAIELVAEAVQKGYRKIVAIGGDGTNNEVVNGIFQQKAVAPSAITYCLLPVGTGNDWIKEYQVPKKLSAWIEMVKRGNTFTQDIGLVHYHKNGNRESRYFANVAGMSYDAFVCAEIDRRKKPLTNRLAYLALGLLYVLKFKLPKALVHFNGQTVENYFYLINAGICRYSGGGMQLVPHAIPDDGQLALTLAGKLTKLGILLNSYRFYNGRIGGHPKVNTFQTDHIFVEAVGEPILVEVDGEVLGETPVEITILPKTLRIIVP